MVPSVSPTSRTRRPIRNRGRTNYREPDSDSDFDLPSSRRSLPTRSSRRLQTYNESSSSSDNDAATLSEFEQEVDESVPRFSVVPATRRSNRKREFRKNATQFSPSPKYKRRKVNNDTTVEKEASSPIHSVRSFVPPPPSGIIPQWQSLEYQILLKIMQYASYPLYTGPSRDSGSVKWLLDTSELCSSFHDACIGALMYSPPLLPSPRAHWLLNLLRASARQFDPTDDDRSTRRTLSLDYRNKIKRLDIEVKQLLIKKKGIQLNELLPLTPLLSELRLYHNHDEMGSAFIWTQPRYSKDKWTYGDLFDVIDSLQIRLKVFEWNGRFLRNDPSLTTLNIAHSKTSLIRLRKVNFLNINVNDVEKEMERLSECRIALINSLYELPELRQVAFHSCNVLDSKTLTKLPSNLQRISLSQCPYVTSSGVQEYLTNAGNTLKIFELLGNQVLDMGFMPHLKDLCPHLEHLTMDLNFSDPTSYRDTEPLFDELLPNGPPTWPDSLSTITLGPLRALSAEDAEQFYESLIEAAPCLPHLKTLVIKTLLKDISWRDRAKMRSKWLGLFEDTFLSTTGALKPSTTTHSKLNDSFPNQSPNETSGRRKSARLRDLEEIGISTPDNGGEHGRSEVSEQDFNAQPNCNVVVFELSDQRPAQDQYTERDFLDDEPTDDGDWNGRDTETVVSRYTSRHYAWEYAVFQKKIRLED